jgi:hypothetical protein
MIAGERSLMLAHYISHLPDGGGEGVSGLFGSIDWSRTFDVVLGAILAILFAIFVERLRKPQITLSIGNTSVVRSSQPNFPIQEGTSLRVRAFPSRTGIPDYSLQNCPIWLGNGQSLNRPLVTKFTAKLPQSAVISCTTTCNIYEILASQLRFEVWCSIQLSYERREPRLVAWLQKSLAVRRGHGR